MCACDFDENARELLWAESVNTANDMENMSSNTLNKKSPFELFTGEQSKLCGKLVEFGRTGQVPIRAKFKGKWKEKSHRAIMVGRAKNHSADACRLHNPMRKSTIENRDVTLVGLEQVKPSQKSVNVCDRARPPHKRRNGR
jgi:hypothetical protein